MMKLRLKISICAGLALGLTGIFAFQNCDNARLSVLQVASNVEVKSAGLVCAQQPRQLTNLHRFLFLIDNSGSMAGLDPGLPRASRRVSGLRKFIDQYKTDDNFTIALGTLAGGMSGFVPDLTASSPSKGIPQATCSFYKPRLGPDYANLQTAMDQLDFQAANAIGSTPYDGALTNLENCLQSDLATSTVAQYSVVIVSDAAPTDITLAQVEAHVKKIIDIGVGTAGQKSRVNIYFVYLDSYSSSPAAAAVIQGTMNTALAEGGSDSRTITVPAAVPIDYSTLGIFKIPNYRLQQLVVTNMNAAIADDGTLDTDSDSDGIPDAKEIAMGFDPLDYASKGNCGDLIYSRNHNSCPASCSINLKYLDTDQDGLSDCDETIMGTKILSVDTDGDGITDDIEVKLGLSPTDPTDRDLDPDRDGVTNYQEAMRFTSPFINDSNVKHKSLQTVSLQESRSPAGTYCYQVTVSGLQVFPTQAVSSTTLPQLTHADGENMIRFMLFEVPEDQPSAKPLILQTYKSVFFNPAANGIIQINDLSTDDFDFLDQISQ